MSDGLSTATTKRKRPSRAGARSSKGGKCQRSAWRHVPVVANLTTKETRQVVEAWIGDKLVPLKHESARRVIETFPEWIDDCPPPHGMSKSEALVLLHRYRRLVDNAHAAKVSRKKAKVRIAQLEEAIRANGGHPEPRSIYDMAAGGTDSASSLPTPAGVSQLLRSLVGQGESALHRIADLEFRLGRVIQKQEALEHYLMQIGRPIYPVNTSLVSPVHASAFREFTKEQHDGESLPEAATTPGAASWIPVYEVVHPTAARGGVGTVPGGASSWLHTMRPASGTAPAAAQ